MELINLKKQYAELARKHSLPSFKVLNDEFEIDKIDKETENILRTVRKVMMEKIVHSLSFLELFLNPINAPRIYLTYIKSMSSEDREAVERIYQALGNLSIRSLQLEIDTSEQKEAEIISLIYGTWNSIKADFRKLLINMNKPTFVQRKEKSYFG